MIETVVHADSVPIQVLHTPCSDPIGRSDDGLLIRSNDSHPDILTSIVAGEHQNPSRVYIYWEKVTTTDNFNLMFIPETQTLFVGAGTISATINLQSLSLVTQNDLTLFWSFQRRSSWVLELGELECFLYELDGTQIGKVPVDPPYEIEEKESGIRIVSIVAGSQWLNFPRV